MHCYKLQVTVSPKSISVRNIMIATHETIYSTSLTKILSGHICQELQQVLFYSYDIDH